MTNLFEISEDYLRLQEELEENGGELTEELAGRLDIVVEQLEEKIKAYYYIIKLQEAQITLSKDEKARLNARQKAKENSIARLKDAVAVAVDMFGNIEPKKKSKSLSFTNLKVWLKETHPFEITDETKIPDKYKTCSIEIDLTAKEKAIAALTLANISYVFSPNILIDKERVKTQCAFENTLSDTEKQERLDAGEKLIEGAIIKTNKTAVFN